MRATRSRNIGFRCRRRRLVRAASGLLPASTAAASAALCTLTREVFEVQVHLLLDVVPWVRLVLPRTRVETASQDSEDAFSLRCPGGQGTHTSRELISRTHIRHEMSPKRSRKLKRSCTSYVMLLALGFCVFKCSSNIRTMPSSAPCKSVGRRPHVKYHPYSKRCEAAGCVRRLASTDGIAIAVCTPHELRRCAPAWVSAH